MKRKGFFYKLILNFVAVILFSMLFLSVSADAASNTVSWKGHYYKLFDQSKTWRQAKKYCEKLGGHLVTVTSKREQNLVYGLVSRGTRNAYWMGGYGLLENWSWVTGESFTYTNWGSGQPDNSVNSYGNENALMMYRKTNPMNSNGSPGTWNDLKDDGTCGEEPFFGVNNMGFICEWEYDLILSDTKIELDYRDTTYITYSLKNNSGNKINATASWKSSNTSVAKVSSKGKVVAVGAGTCKITCKVKGISKTVTIVVKPQKVTSVKCISKSRSFIQLTWLSRRGVYGYEVYMYDRDIEEYTKVKTVKASARSARITGLKKGKTYKFKVRAYIKNGSKKYYGKFSKVYSVKTKTK